MSDTSIGLTLDQIKSKVKKIDMCMPSNEQSIQADIKELLDVVRLLEEQASLSEEVFESLFPKSQAKSYLTSEFLFFLCKYLIEFKQFQMEDNQKNSNLIIEYSVRLCLKILRDQPDSVKIYETLRFVLDPERLYYKCKNQAILNQNRFSPDNELTEEQILFIDGLKEGDQIDALKSDNKLQYIDWSRGTIISINNNANTMLVEWVGEQGGVRSIDKYSWDVAPFKSRVPDSEWDWKFEIKAGDVIDCPDENVWYNATVVSNTNDELKVGFRHYDNKGIMVDEIGKYFGWSSQYDEVVPLLSPKVQKKGKFAKPFCKYASLSNAEESIKDQNDFIYNLGYQHYIYGVPRYNTKCQRKSLLMVKLIQIFGEQGGFDLFYERITDQTKWCQIEILTQIMTIFGQMHEMLHRKFVYEYVPKVLEAVNKNLVQSPDSNLRNFSYQRINDTLQGLGNLCKRYYSLKDKNEQVDKLDMDIAMRCFNSEFLERQIHGLKAIQDLIRRTKESQATVNNSDLKYLNVQIIVDWINENRVFESIYTGQNSSYIVQRSSDFLKFMLDEKLVSLEQLEMIVKSAKKGEMEDKQAIYKVRMWIYIFLKILKDVSQSFSRAQLMYVIQMISEGQPQQLTKDDLELLLDISKYNYKYKEDFNALFVKFYWSLINQGDRLQPDILETVINNYVDVRLQIINQKLINSFDYRPQREQNLKLLGASIQNDIQLTLMLRVVQRFIDKLEVLPLSWDTFTKDVALTQLQSENSIIDSIFSSLSTFKSTQSGQEMNYLEEIKSRTEFIQFFYSNIKNKQYTLGFETVGRLWDELVERAKIPQERDILYRWFSSSDLARGVQIDDIQRFFEQRMTKNIPSLTEEGFNCLQSLINLINSSSNKFLTSDDYEKYVVQGELHEIFGFSTIQEIICQANDHVSLLARQFMVSLIRKHQTQQQALESYLTYTFEQLELQDGNRLLLTIQDVLDQSECNGIEGLISIGALAHGEQIQLDFINLCTQGWSVQKKFSLYVNENDTLYDLRLLIQQKIKTPWDAFNFLSNDGKVKFQDNGKIIRDLRIKRNEVITITKRQVNGIPEADILDKLNNLTAEAKRVFSEVFTEFSTDGLMNKEQCARYVTACTGNTCLPDDHQIARTFEQYDKDKDGYLTDENFNEFYHEATKSKKSTVWLNLRMLHYRNDLIRGDRVTVHQFDPKQLPRYLISRSSTKMQVLFAQLEGTKLVRQEAWNLLVRLPPSPLIVMKLLTFEQNNSEMLDQTSDYKLLYNLYIIEYLMEQKDLSLLLDDGENTHQNQNWTVQFVEHGGFEQFLSTFYRFNGEAQDAIHKQILSLLLKILSNFLSAVFHPSAPFLYQTIKLAQSLSLRSDELQQHKQIPEEFLALVSSLQEVKLQDTLKLYKQLLMMVRDQLTSKSDLEAEDRQIIEYAMMVVMCIVLEDESLLRSEFENDQLLKILIEGLLTNKSQNLRQFFAKQAFLVAYQSQAHLNQQIPTQRLFEQLVLQLSECSRPQNASSSEQYYELLSVLVENSSQADFVNYEDLAITLVKTLRQHESSETLQRVGPDKLIVGLLTLLQKIVVMRPDVREVVASQEGLIQVIFNECLFSFQPNKTVKCKSKESRQAAFKLLKGLCVDNPSNTQHLIQVCLTPLAQQVPAITSWNHVPGNDQRCNGYLGLKNLGCICYMIAMLQQFFVTPTFRYAILMADDGEPPNMQPRPKDGALVDDNVFHQFQKMFAFLERSDRLDYNPTDFCFAFKDFTGQPVDVSIQQDSQEFLNMIFDKLEQSLKPTPFKNILESIFGGKTVTQLTCAECKYVRNKEENFFNISLPIKNQKTLHECFDKFISEEVISDYRCDGCNKKVDVTKRQMLQEMPNVLILHLQRIVFNLDTLTNEKINSRVDFPQELNLQSYLVESVQDPSQYKLVGVVVHFGAAEFGHYFSYIDIQRDEASDPTNSKWFEFNDSKVKDFKVSNLENECFGGPSVNNDSSEDFGWWKTNRENSQNAYILVYEKLKKTPLKLEYGSQEQLIAFQDQFSLRYLSTKEKQDGIIEVEVDYYGLPSYVPEELSSMVATENQQFQLERSLYDPEFFSFLNEMCKGFEMADMDLTQPYHERWQEVPELQMRVNEQLLTTLIPYNFDLLARAYENRLLEPLVERMRYLLHLSPSFSFEFLDKLFFQRGVKTIDLLLQCPEAQTRQLVASILAQTFNANIAFFKLSLQPEGEQIQRDRSLPPTREVINNSVTRCLTILLDLLNDQVAKNWVRFEQYFLFWREFANGGEVQMKFLLHKKVLTYFLDFMLEGQSPIKLQQDKKFSMGNPYYQPNFAILFEVCLKLIEMSDQLSQDDNIMIYSSRLIEKLMKNIKKQPLIITYFVSMSQDNELYSEILCSCTLRSITQFSQEDFIPLSNLIVLLLTLQDSLQSKRIEWILGYPQNEPKYPKTASQEPQFGIYGFNSLDEDIFKYPSPLHYQTSLLDLIIQNLGQYKRNDNLGMLAISTLIQAMVRDQSVRQYVLQLPAINYTQTTFINSFWPFIEHYQLDSKRYYFSNFPREEITEECLKWVAQFNEIVSIQSILTNPSYLIGSTIKSTTKKILFVELKGVRMLISQDQDQELFEKVYNDKQYEKICIIQETSYTVFTSSSKPNGNGNDVFPENIVKGSVIFNYLVKKDSQLSSFIEPKSSSWSSHNTVPYDYNNFMNNQVQENNKQQQQQQQPDETDHIIEGFQESDCIKTISITNLKSKSVHFTLKLKEDMNLHLPHSLLQKIIKSNFQMNFVTLMKKDVSLDWLPLDYDIEYNVLEGHGDALFITPLTSEQRALFAYR